MGYRVGRLWDSILDIVEPHFVSFRGSILEHVFGRAILAPTSSSTLGGYWGLLVRHWGATEGATGVPDKNSKLIKVGPEHSSN